MYQAGGKFFCNVSMVVVRIVRKVSGFRMATRFTIKSAFAVNNFIGRAKLVL